MTNLYYEYPESLSVMKRLKPFAYFEPATLAEASKILIDQGSRAYLLAGGTDLLVRMKRGEIDLSALVNLKGIDGMNRIELDAETGLQIGALTTISSLEQSSLVRSAYPVLAEAAGILGSPPIRNLATLGGNIGRASPASDLAPALMVLMTRLLIDGPEGKKEFPLESIFSRPGKTTLNPGEVITSFFVPKMVVHSGAAYVRLGRRGGMDCALVGVAVLLNLSAKSGDVAEARIALASVAPVPIRARKAEAELLSGPLTEERIQKAATAAALESMPISDMRASASYRKEMVKVSTRRAIEQARTLAGEGNNK
jgi:carbon-monoxide dehydrogenase medium subunit